MKYIIAFYFLLFSFPSHGQKKKLATQTITGKTVIGPVCPVEPCDFSREQWKQFYSHFRVMLYDSKMKVLKSLPLDSKGHFLAKVPGGIYYARIQSKEGQAVNPPEPVQIKVSKGKNISVNLEYDTGIR